MQRTAQYSHFVVNQMHLLQRRIKLRERPVRCWVRRVNWTIAARRTMFFVLAHSDLYSRFTHRHRVSPMLVNNSKAEKLEIRTPTVSKFIYQYFKTRFCGFKLKAIMLKSLKFLEYRLLATQIQIQLPRLSQQVSSTRQIGQQHPTFVADDFRRDVLVRLRVTLHRGNMNTALVSERTFSHEGSARLKCKVRDLTNKTCCFAQVPELHAADHFSSQFELQVRNHGTQVGIATTFAITIDCSLYMYCACADCGE